MELRKELDGCSRVVVKVGSSVITKSNGKIDTRKIRQIVEDISDLTDAGIEVVLVSSGAVALGRSYLKRKMPRAGQVELQHSASSVGQPKLINTYSRIFEENQKICSQVLLTHSDFRDRKRFLHTKQNLEVLLKNGLIPILNENDSISFTEITVGDNDHLAAQTAQMVNADALLVITSTDGLYDKDPAEPGAKQIKHIPFGREFTDINFDGKTSMGRGGMESKIHAVSKITPLGIRAIISTKNRDRFILSALTKNVGTFFSPKSEYDPEERKAWLISTKKPNCFIEVDDGACSAVLDSKSLFATGIVNVFGDFFQGDCVEIRCKSKTIATGICEYSNEELKRIMGNHSNDFEGILGFKKSCEVMNTINIVIEKEVINERISS